jgi:hypothetical protein
VSGAPSILGRVWRYSSLAWVHDYDAGGGGVEGPPTLSTALAECQFGHGDAGLREAEQVGARHDESVNGSGQHQGRCPKPCTGTGSVTSTGQGRRR